MARRHGNNRRRRRGRFAGLLRLLGIVLVIGAVIAALTLFFKAEEITVSGNTRYSEQEVVDASGLRLGDNLFLMNKYTVAQMIFEKLPYVEHAVIRRHLPNGLSIEVQESRAVAGLVTMEGTWLISMKGKLLETTASIPEGCPVVTGGELPDAAPSKQLSFGEEEGYRAELLLSLLAAAEKHGMLDKIESIDLTDDTSVRLAYMGRFTVKMPWGADVDYKMQNLQAVADYLEENEVGEIDLMTDGKASFIPKSK